MHLNPQDLLFPEIIGSKNEKKSNGSHIEHNSDPKC